MGDAIQIIKAGSGSAFKILDDYAVSY
ncbi:hypothetical protein METHP14_250030 [Pseudomonas sp. P14-2025]